MLSLTFWYIDGMFINSKAYDRNIHVLILFNEIH